MDNVQISCKDAIRVIFDRDTPETFFYLDPPYPGCAQGHYRGYRLEDLSDLIKVLETIQGKFILSNYWCDLLRESVEKNSWGYQEIEVSMKVAVTGRRRVQEIQYRTEVLVHNYPVQIGLFDELL